MSNSEKKSENQHEPSRQISTQTTQSTKSLPPFKQRYLSWRMLMVLQIQCMIILSILLRMNIPVAMICMLKTPITSSVNSTDERVLSRNQQNHSTMSTITNTQRFLNLTFHNDSIETNTQGEFDWDSSIQGLVLTSYNILVFVMPLSTDYFVRRVGGKNLLQFSVVSAGVFTILQPIGARMSPYILVVLRMLIGLVAGVGMPLVNEILSWWAPENEKVSMISLVFGGVNLGNILAGVTTAYLCMIPIDNGWPFIFYIQGALCLVWCVLWQVFGSMKPEEHGFISENEKLYIISTRLGMDSNQKRSKPPYKKIATSKPVWSYLLTCTCHVFATTLFFMILPFFIRDVFKLTVQEVGILTSSCYTVRLIASISWGCLSNFLYIKIKLSKTFTRKIVQCSGFLISGVTSICLGYFSSFELSIVVIIILMSSQCSTLASGIVMPLDMAPRFAGFLTGLFTTLSGIVATPGPLIASVMTQNGTIEEWRNVFIMTGVTFLFGCLVFGFFADAKIQSWALSKTTASGSSKEEDVEEIEVPNAQQLMARRMTVMSMGMPTSPGIKSSNFNFTLHIQGEQPDFSNASISKIHTPTESTNSGFIENGFSLKQNGRLTSKTFVNEDHITPESGIVLQDLSQTNPGFNISDESQESIKNNRSIAKL